MSGKKRTDWQWEAQQRALAEQRRRERLAEEARRQELARQAEIRRALEESLQRSVRERTAQLGPAAAQASELLAHTQQGIDVVTSRAYADELESLRDRRQRLDTLVQDVVKLGALSGSALVNKNVDPNGAPFSELAQALTEVSSMVARLEELRYHEGQERQRELAARIGEVESSSASATAYAGGAEFNRSMSREVEAAHQALSRGEFDEVDRTVKEMRASIDQWLSSAATLREHRLERRAVLDALRDSCRKLDFQEMNSRQLDADLKDPDGDWNLVVRHPTRGQIAFIVGDISIQSDSAIGVIGDQVNGDQCFSAFQLIEDELAEDYGLVTKFVSDTVPRDPRDPPTPKSKTRPAQTSITRAQRQP